MKTVSLELAKQLKEAGFPQKTEFYYWSRTGNYQLDHKKNLYLLDKEIIAAPMAVEMLDHLPERMTITKTKDDRYQIDYKSDTWSSDNITNVLANAWLYLKKNNLLKGSIER